VEDSGTWHDLGDGPSRSGRRRSANAPGYSRSMVQFRYGTKEALLERLLRDEHERAC
jgi:hypothetical protein